jgi:hypothetical protein
MPKKKRAAPRRRPAAARKPLEQKGDKSGAGGKRGLVPKVPLKTN